MKILKTAKLTSIYIIAAVIFFLVNFLVSTYSLRLDASYGRAYTLSPSTINIVKRLDSTVTMKFFVSSDLPTRFLPLKNSITDLLYEYQKINFGRISVKILDPQKDQTAANDAKDLGIPALQFSQLEQNNYAVTSSYLGIAISYGGKNEILPQVTDVESLEYNLTAAIYKLTRKTDINIGIVGPPDQLTSLTRLLQQQFNVDNLDISSNSAIREIDPSYKTVLVVDNGQVFDDQSLTALKKYLDTGGRVIFFTGGVDVGENLSAVPGNNSLAKLFSDYGIKVNSNLVLSDSADIVNFGNSQMSFLVPYAFWVKTNVFNTKAPYFSNINQLTLPWPSSLTMEKKKNVETTPIIQTTDKSWQETKDFNLNPQAIKAPADNYLKQFNLAADAKKTDGGEIVVIASSRFPLDQYQNQLSDNLGLILNIANNFASGGALAGIRQRAVSFYPLPDISSNEKDIFKYGNILILPALFALFGAYWLIKRK